MKKVSVIIPSYNDTDVLRRTLQSLFENNKNIYEVIVVDDGSEPEIFLGDIYIDKRVKLIRSPKNKGVGQSFDLGVDVCGGDILYLMGSDIRFDNNNAIDRMADVAWDNYNKLVCCGCTGVLDKAEFTPSKDREHMKLHKGASIKWKITNRDLSENHVKKYDETYRDIIQAKWIRHKPENELTDIPCILGASYAVTKKWYQYIKGFDQHRIWGGLEPMISIKSHLAGGGCIFDDVVYTGHLFSRGVSARDTWAMYWNKVYMAHMFFDKEIRDDLLEHVMVWKPPIIHNDFIRKNWSNIYKDQRDYYDQIFVNDVRDTILWETWGK